MLVKAILIFASAGSAPQKQPVFAAERGNRPAEAKGAGSIEDRVSGPGTLDDEVVALRVVAPTHEPVHPIWPKRRFRGRRLG
jgi:hypothetical protein